MCSEWCGVPDGMAICVERPSPVTVDRRIQMRVFEPWSSQTDDLKIYTCPLPSQAISINSTDQEFVCSVSG